MMKCNFPMKLIYQEHLPSNYDISTNNTKTTTTLYANTYSYSEISHLSPTRKWIILDWIYMLEKGTKLYISRNTT